MDCILLETIFWCSSPDLVSTSCLLQILTLLFSALTLQEEQDYLEDYICDACDRCVVSFISAFIIESVFLLWFLLLFKRNVKNMISPASCLEQRCWSFAFLRARLVRKLTQHFIPLTMLAASVYVCVVVFVRVFVRVRVYVPWTSKMVSQNKESAQ